MTDNWPHGALVSPEIAKYIGLISVEWQELQRVFDFYILALTPNGKQGEYLAHELNNAQKIEYIRESINTRSGDPDGIAHVLEFLKFAQICAENRNTLLHATGNMSNEAPDTALFQKYSSKRANGRNTYLVPIRDLKRMADEMVAVRGFGKLTLASVVWGGSKRYWQPPNEPEKRVELPLPSKPPQPRKLDSNLLKADGKK